MAKVEGDANDLVMELVGNGAQFEERGYGEVRYR